MAVGVLAVLRPDGRLHSGVRRFSETPIDDSACDLQKPTSFLTFEITFSNVSRVLHTFLTKIQSFQMYQAFCLLFHEFVRCICRFAYFFVQKACEGLRWLQVS